GVKQAQVDFMTTKLTVKVESDQAKQIETKAKELIGKLEPDIAVISLDQKNTVPTENASRNQFVRIVLALFVFLALIMIKPTGNIAFITYLLL
ncbi:heavy metal translocating P-type ATPase, partial [Enterococcus faecalis]